MKYYFYLVVCLLAGCSDATTTRESAQGQVFTRADLKDAWPFTSITKAEVLCLDGQHVVMRTNLGMYALNGAARQVAADKGWKTLDGEQIVGKDISQLIQAGLKLCR